VKELTLHGSLFIILPIMRKIISAEEMRLVDRRTSESFAVPSLLLMESAATGVANHLSLLLPSTSKALILCGPGNNGGDGAALARLLWVRGFHIDVVLFGSMEKLKGDVRTNFEIVSKLASLNDTRLSFLEFNAGENWKQLADLNSNYDVVVDALFGTGLTRPLDGIFREVAEHINSLKSEREKLNAIGPLIVSLDLPSGLNADIAEPIGPTVTSDLTITFTAPKPANVLPPASFSGGELEIVDIGSPYNLIDEVGSRLFLVERDDACNWLKLTRYKSGSYKNTHGHSLIIAGSKNMSGAAVLCGKGAMKSGSGLVTVATSKSAFSHVTARVIPEIMTAALPETAAGAINLEALELVAELSNRATAIAIGPGLTAQDESTRRFVREVVERRTVPVVIDADGLNALAPWPEELRGSYDLPIVITPHAGEMLRLLGEKDKDQLSDRLKRIQEFATTYHVILVLKGARTLIAAPDGRVFINPTGNPGLGTAGTGDTLTGIITSFLAQSFALLADNADALSAVITAVYIGGLAGDIAAKSKGMRTLVASDVSDFLGAAILELDPIGEQP
jgi:ADP-dependent NAD(P)H-hydrate dehydratase / NAD(P)H-hydrate epimerase